LIIPVYIKLIYLNGSNKDVRTAGDGDDIRVTVVVNQVQCGMNSDSQILQASHVGD
jgi:hypothetical protein